MAAKDGLLVRLRITGGILTPPMTEAIADGAARYGSGFLDLSSRANLQLRGIGESAWPRLVADLRRRGLAEGDAAGEAVRNVVSSPLAGCHDGLDIRPIVAALEAHLAADTTLHALPGKFGFLVDDGGLPSLADEAADVRFDWQPETATFAIALGGTRETALPIGHCGADKLVAHAHAAAKGALRLFHEDGPRRMRGLIDAHGADTVAQACGGLAMPVPVSLASRPRQRHDVVGASRIAGRFALGLAAPFGRLDAAMLRFCARVAARKLGGTLRLTPWRAILVPDAAVDESDIRLAAAQGFIVDPSDPRLDVSACVGREGCERGSTPTHADAASLADLARSLAGPLHVSGCTKGCAHPDPAAVTLVAREGRYDLVRDGRASDTPAAHRLDLAGVRALLTS